MASGRSANLNKSILLVILMITMTQVGYLESINPWRSGEETLDKTTDLLETGGQGSASYSLGQSTFGEAVALNAAIEPITFEYRENSDAATLYGNGSLWTVNQTSNPIGTYISPQRASTGNNSMLNDEVFFFDNGNCDISMHNTSNGTTWEAFAISPCSSSSSSRPFDGRSFFVSGEHFLFQLYDSTQPQQIWAYNTSNGTSWRIGGGTFSDTSGYLKSQDDLFQHGNDFWFWGYESGSRSQLYRINGSTMEVEARSNFTASCYLCTSGYVGGWAASNGSIYFVTKVTPVGMKVYFHDIGTNQTSLAFDINPSGAGVFGLTQVSDNLLFVNGMNTSSSGLKLWAHNTTTNQTYLQSDITPTLIATNPLIDDVYYFYATNTSTGNELHAYSIVNNSTWLVDDIQPGSVGSRPSYSMYQVSPLLQAYEGKLFILADDGTNGDEVWVHDPSTAETYRLTNLGNDVENIQDLVGDTLYFISSKSGYCCYMYAHSMSTNSTYEVPNFPDGRYYQTGARFFLPVNGTIYMNGGHGPSSNNPIQALVAWSPSAITPMTTPVAGATCSVSSTLPFGLALNQGNCTVSGTPTVVTPQSNYTLTATINGQTYGATFWLTTDYLPMRPSVAELEASIGVAITDISFGGFGEPGDGGYGEPFNYNHQSIYAGHDGFCFILETGELRCDGDNYIEGQGPVAVVADVFVEPSLPADAVVKHVLPGSKNHVCAILVNESLYCWGGNTFGQLGNGNYNTQYTPVHIPLPTGRTVEKISADHEFSCALLDNGSIMCWGRNHEGQLGRGTTATSGQNSPGYVSILPQGRHAVDVGVGSEHVCALLDNNDVVCWGANNSMTGSSSITVPQTLSFPSNQSVLSIAAIGKASCALMDNGSVRCWGSNGWYHALGVTGASTTGTPTLTATMPGGLNATALIAHHDGVCATLENFSIACWGAIQYTHVVEPTIPSFPHGSMQITSFAASNNRACYALENGSLWCGTSSTGAGDFIDIESPIQSSLPTLISGATCSISPPLPSGLSLTQGTCKIIGTPTALASNQTYAVFANTTEGTYRGEVNIAVVGEVVDTPIVLLNNSDVDEIAPFYPVTGATYALSPDLPTSMQFDASNGSIWGTPDMLMTNSTYTMWANLTDGTSTLWAFFLEVLEDLDGDGMPDVLPGDYDGSNDPIRSPPGLVEDLDDDGDGYNDTAETDTGTYVDENNTGTDPRDPDTDDDGICDGPNAVAGVCVAGPDTTNGPNMITTPVVLVNNSEVSEIAPFITVSGATYALSPDLPTSMQFDASNGSIWGTSDMVMSNSTYTMWANLTDGTGTSWTFFLEVLEDLDGDGMPDVLPGDYDGSNDPIRSPPGLVEDLDDDGDGYNDTAETDTGLYLDGNNTGTDPRDPDTDDDGICDGPNAVSPICIAGPDLTPFGPPATVVAVNNSMIPSVPPYYAGSGLTYEVMPDLPNGLTIDANNGYLMGIPTETTSNITYTVFANLTDGTSYSWDFTIEVLEDSDGDGSPDTLPADYDGDDDSIRAPPGLTEDLDDDGDGESDLDEIENGTEPLNPDTDGDGFCDGINAVSGVCFAGPDPNPLDPNLPLDTDGDGLPDDDSAWTGPPYADDDDDNDGFPDVSEDACGSDSLDANSIPNDMDGDTICDGDDDDKDGDGIDNVNETGELGVPPGSSPINPDTDGDGICDGPESPVTSNCTAGPDMFPLDPSAWEDTDGDGYPNELFPPSNSTPPLEEDLDDDNDGWTDIDEVNCGSDPVNVTDVPLDLNGDGICDVLDLDWDDDGIPNANETDTGIYNDPSDMGTDPWNPDTDGDGFCDGPFAVFNGTDTVCIGGPDPFPLDPTMPFDTDGDGLPNEMPEDYIGNLEEDMDDDNDGYSDVSELNCDSDPLNASSTPTNDLDGDGICDAQDDDVDGDGLSNVTEQDTNSTSLFNNADTDGDGICDGPLAPAMPIGVCTAGPDAFPNDPAAWIDTDGDGKPDDIVPGIETDLVLDLDDDNDQWADEDEAACGTDPKDVSSTPLDGDDDEICDVLDVKVLGYTMNDQEASIFEGYVNQSDFVILPNLTGMEPGTWTIEPALPAGLSFSGTARSGETGIISGIPTESSNMTNYTVYANNSQTGVQFTFEMAILADTDGDGLPDEGSVTGLGEDLDDDNDGHLDEIEIKCGSDPTNQTSVPNVDENDECITGVYADDDDDDGGFSPLWCLPILAILLLILLLFGLLLRDKVELIGPEPENTTAEPNFLSGVGTKDNPFVLRPIKALKAGGKAETKEAISIINMSPEIVVNLLDLAEATNDKRFMVYEIDGTSEEPGYRLEADEEGRLRIRFVFDDSINPTYQGGDYEGLIKLGKASVYFSWTVGVKQDKKKMNELKKQQEAEEKAAEEKAAKEAEKKAKADEKAAAAAATALAAKEAKEEADAKKKADADAKAAKESEKKAKAEEKAAAAALAAKAKEEEDAKKKADADAKAAKEAEEKAAAAKKKAEKKPAATTKEVKKQEELQRVKKRAKSIDFKVIGEATSTKLKSEVKKGSKTLEVGDASEFADSGSAAITDSEGSTLIAWTGKDGNVLTGVSGVTRVFAAASIVMVKDDLQVIKGIGPFLEEKLNALGITTYRQLANMNAKLEEQVNVAIEFFPGRVKRDQWVAQAKILLGEDVKLDEKALKQAEDLERIAQKADGIDFGILGVATIDQQDDLQTIKGIGPFIAEKLYALGIYTFEQVGNMTSEIEEQVNEAIEFFPGRVKRDEWAKQGRELHKKK